MDLDYLINHIFLPPRLPQADDHDISNDRILTELVRETLHAAAAIAPNDPCWSSLSTMTDMLPTEENPDVLSSNLLIDTLGSMASGGELLENLMWNNLTWHRCAGSSHPCTERRSYRKERRISIHIRVFRAIINHGLCHWYRWSPSTFFSRPSNSRRRRSSQGYHVQRSFRSMHWSIGLSGLGRRVPEVL